MCDICSARRTKCIGRKGYNSIVIKKVKIEPTGDQQILIEKFQRKQKGSCAICFQEKVGPGIHHPFGPKARKNNLTRLTLRKRDGAEKVAVKILKGISDNRKIGQGENMKLKQQEG